MATAGTYVDIVMRRTRDPNAVGLTRAFVRDLISRSQRMVNAQMRTVKESLTLATNPNQQFYPVTINAPASVRVEYVREGDRDLRKVTIQELSEADTKWFRKVADRFELWAPVGRDQIVVHPAKAITSSVEVIYTKLTDELIDDTILAELPEDDMTHVLDLAEMLTLLKQRRPEMVEPVLTQYMERAKLMREK